MKEDYHKWYSNYIKREFELLVFGHSGYPLILFPTSGGRYFEAKDRGLINSVQDFINDGKIKVYCPDSINTISWYNYSVSAEQRVLNHISYENVILNEVIEFARYETGFEKVAVGGCSFGGYHAANLTFRHPDLVSYFFSMGGAFDIKRFIHGFYNDNCYFNNPPDYLPGLNDNWYLDNIKNTGIALGTGEQDMCLDENKRLSDILNSKNIDHWLDIRSGTGHDWNWWKEMLPAYVNQINF